MSSLSESSELRGASPVWGTLDANALPDEADTISHSRKLRRKEPRGYNGAVEWVRAKGVGTITWAEGGTPRN